MKADRLLQRVVHLIIALGLASFLNVSTAADFTDANWISMGGISGADGTVYASVVDGSGNLYIGGDFTVVGEVIAQHIAKWDGVGWTALGSVMIGSVHALAVSGGD